MGRPRKVEGPLYVYLHRGKYQGRYWDKQKLHTVGSFSDPREAAYASLVAKQGHHWEGMPTDISGFFGFIYLITNRDTGKKYIGSKQFFKWAGPQGGYKETNPMAPYWDSKAWAENDWQFYASSSDELSAEIKRDGAKNYQFNILELCEDKLALHLCEIKWMVELDVLEALDEYGEYAFYNKNIGRCLFRAPFKHSDVEAARAISEDAARRYYLKPTHCPKCGRVIPFGFTTCTCATSSSALEI